MNNSFFTDLVNKSLIYEWAKNIDWLFNENKFNHWGKKEKIKLTKLMKNYFLNKEIDVKKLKINEFDTINMPDYNYFYYTCSSSESISIINHIRNGIAHGHCNIKKKRDNTLYLIITDYTKPNGISAKINIPISLVTDIRLLYKKTINNKK